MSIKYKFKLIECHCHTGMHHWESIEVSETPQFICESHLDPEVEEAVQQAIYGKILSKA